MTRPSNAKKDAFLKSIPTASVDSYDDKITDKCKFNFAYMDFSQPSGQRFEDWEKNKLDELLNKLHNYSKESLLYWTQQRIGARSNTVLEIYGKFPVNSEFTHPKHVPHQALWGRFRLEGRIRLIGFVLPSEYHHRPHPRTRQVFDCNTFYVVFLDENHRFYIIDR